MHSVTESPATWRVLGVSQLQTRPGNYRDSTQVFGSRGIVIDHCILYSSISLFVITCSLF